MSLASILFFQRLPLRLRGGDKVYTTMDEDNTHLDIPIILMPRNGYYFKNEACYAYIKAIDEHGNVLIEHTGPCYIKLIPEPEEYNQLNSQLNNEVSVTQEEQTDQSSIWMDALKSPTVRLGSSKFPQVQESYSLSEDANTNMYDTYDDPSGLQSYFGENTINLNDVQTIVPLEYEYVQSLQETTENLLIENSYTVGNGEDSGVVIHEYISQKAVRVEEEKTEKRKGREETIENLPIDNSYSVGNDEYSQDSGVAIDEEYAISNSKEIREVGVRTETKKGLVDETVNIALKQLMSADPKGRRKPHKKIMFTGRDPEHAETIQVTYEDTSEFPGEVDNEVEIEATDILEENSRAASPESRKKKYQCDLCPQKYNSNSELKEHRATHRKTTRSKRSKTATDDVQNFTCVECEKVLKGREKYEDHCLAHGDPERECDVCYKVFATKFTLRAHKKIHNRQFPCSRCSRTYDTAQKLSTHTRKSHKAYMCTVCDFVTDRRPEYLEHNHDSNTIAEPKVQSPIYGEEYLDIQDMELILDDIGSTDDNVFHSNEVHNEESEKSFTKTFVAKRRKMGKTKKMNKTCKLCPKSFDRSSDLKRHLIEHMLRKVLQEAPVDVNGELLLRCPACPTNFSKVDKFKSHLREHAKLTQYLCNICHKSFSDSSNFTKHKKIHSNNFYQCDYCHHKFSSKRQLINDINLHMANGSMTCKYCPKEFYFESTLNKHVLNTHRKHTNARYRCKFCLKYFGTLKDKWDHEWEVHSSRKVVADCQLCDKKFRKYADLKRHCSVEHSMAIPRAKHLLRKTY